MKNKNLWPYIDIMPQDNSAQFILHQRALQLAKPIQADTNNHKNVRYVRFKLGSNEHYGIDYRYIKEIIQNTSLTKVPGAPEFIAGLINLRGNLFAVMDLKQYFHLEPTSYNNNTDIIMLEANSLTIGILTDNIEESDSYDPTLLDKAMHTTNIVKPEYIIGLHSDTKNTLFSAKITAIIHIEALIADLNAK